MDNVTPDQTQTVDTAAGTPDNQQVADKDWRAEAEKWKHFAREHEERWKRVSRELDELKRAQMTDAEKALAEAEQRGRQAALQEVLGERVRDRLRAEAAMAGVPAVQTLVDRLDVNHFVREGDIDTNAIQEFLSSLSSDLPKAPKYPQNLGIGPQSSSSNPGQLTREDLRNMTPREIMQARKDGRLNHLMSGGG